MTDTGKTQRPLVRSRPNPAEVRSRHAVRPPEAVSPLLPRPASLGLGRFLPAVSALLLAAGLVLSYTQLSTSRSVAAHSVPPASLGLTVSHANAGLTLGWNPSAAAFHGLSEAEVLIADGQPSRLLLSTGQIRRGTLWYIPRTADVRFTMRAGAGDHMASETAIALEIAPLQRSRGKLRQAALAAPIASGAVTFPPAEDRPH